MNNFVENIDINKRLNIIFKNRFDIDLFNNELNINIDDNLLGSKFKLAPRDLIYLLYDVEKEFSITISKDDIDNIEFNTINNIINIINLKLDQKKRNVI